MRRLIVAFTLFLFTLSFTSAPAFAGGTVLKKGQREVIVWSSRSSPDKHWIQRDGAAKSKKKGKASAVIRKYISRGYKKTGTAPGFK